MADCSGRCISAHFPSCSWACTSWCQDLEYSSQSKPSFLSVPNDFWSQVVASFKPYKCMIIHFSSHFEWKYRSQSLISLLPLGCMHSSANRKLVIFKIWYMKSLEAASMIAWFLIGKKNRSKAWRSWTCENDSRWPFGPASDFARNSSL